jgi:hypothetical protein
MLNFKPIYVHILTNVYNFVQIVVRRLGSDPGSNGLGYSLTD